MSKKMVLLFMVVLAMVLLAGESPAVDCSLQPYLCCSGHFWMDPAVCSHHGVCQGNDVCDCYAHWTGQNCQNRSCGSAGTGTTYTYNLDGLQFTDDNRCSLHGTCDTAGTGCICNPGWMGIACEFPTNGILAPAALDFGTVTVGTPGPVRSITFTNTSIITLTLGVITLTGANSAEFVLGGSCANDSQLHMGENCTIVITFTPQAIGSRSATINVAANYPDVGFTKPLTVNTSLTGTGIISTSSIVIDPTTPATLYAGLDGAGVYKSTNSGGSWNEANGTTPNNLTDLRVKVLARTTTGKLYAGTYGGGVFKSTDSGDTWSACTNTNLTNLNVVSLTIDANGKLYAGTEAGVFASGDECANWTAINSGLPN